MATLIKGENGIAIRALLDEDGNPIPVSSLNYLKAQVIQYHRVIETYNYTPGVTDPEISAVDNEVTLQITEELSAKFKEGLVYIRLLGKQTNSDYTVDGSLYDIDEQECFEVIL